MPYITSPQTPTLPSNSSAAPADIAPADTVSSHDTVDTRPERKRFLGLSLSQILGGSLAATTAAFLGARLGLAGTLFGAAIASVVSAIASAAYAHSIDRTRNFLRTTRVVTTTTAQRADAVDPATPPREVLEPVPSGPRTLRLDLRRVGLATLAVFAATAIAITGYEFASGHALDGKEGTTVSQVVSGGGNKAATVPTTGATTSAPTATATATVTVTATQSPSSTATGSPTSSTTSSTSPSATASDPTTPAPTSTTPTP